MSTVSLSSAPTADEQQEHVLLTHDALRAWELCGSEILRALLIGHDNRK